MTEKDNKLQEISNELNEHITAIKGTLELIDASVDEDDLRSLLMKAVERMDSIQRLSSEMFVLLKACLDRMDDVRK